MSREPTSFENPITPISHAFRECITDCHFTQDDQRRFLAFLAQSPQLFRKALEQVILKTIKVSHTLSSRTLDNFETFFGKFFRFLVSQPPTDQTTEVLHYFYTFFSIAVFASNHFIKSMMGRYLLLLVESPLTPSLPEKLQIEIFDAAFGLIKDASTKNKHTALKIMAVLQNNPKHPEVSSKAHHILLMASAVDPEDSIRSQAASKVALNKDTIDAFAFRAMDVLKSVSELSLQRLVSEGWKFTSLRVNTRCHVANACNNSSSPKIRDDLQQLILPGSLQDQDEDITIPYRRLCEVVAAFELDLILRSAKINLVVQSLLSHGLSKCKLNHFKYILDQIMQELFGKASPRDQSHRKVFDNNLFLLLHLWGFLKEKVEEGFVEARKEQLRRSAVINAPQGLERVEGGPGNSDFGSTDPAALEAEAEIIPKKDEDPLSQGHRLSVSHRLNPEDYGKMDQHQTNRIVLGWIEEKLPTGGRIFQIFQEALASSMDNWTAVIHAELMLRLICAGNIAELALEKYVECLELFVTQFKVPHLSLEHYVEESNKEKLKMLNIYERSGEEMAFLPALSPSQFVVEWVLSGKKLARPLMLLADVLSSACHALQHLITDDGNAFTDKMLHMLAAIKPTKRRNEPCIHMVLVACFFMEHYKGATEFQSKRIEECMDFLLKRIEKTKKKPEGTTLATLLEAAVFKSFGLFLLKDIPRMLTTGIAFLDTLEGDNAILASTENRMISSATLFDFLIKFDMPTLNKARQSLIRDHMGGLLDLEVVLETLKRYLLEETDPAFRTILLQGFCRLFVKNWRMPVSFHMDPPEFLAILQLLWTHYQRTKEQDPATASMATLLGTFTMVQAMTSPECCANLLEALVVVIELILHMKSTSYTFNKDVLNLEVEREESIQHLLGTFVSLTLQENNGNIGTWYFDGFMGAHPQEFMVLYLIKRGEDFPELLNVANGLVRRCDFWEKDNPRTTKFLYHKTLKFAKERQFSRLRTLGSLNLRLEALIVQPEMSTNAVLADIQEREAFLDEKMAALKQTASSLFKTLKDTKRWFREPKLSEMHGHQREPSKRLKRR